MCVCVCVHVTRRAFFVALAKCSRVRAMVLVGGISDRGVWEMGDDREMLDVRVEIMRGER